VTEPKYLDAFRRHERNDLVEIVIERAAGVPKTLVETAVDRKRKAARTARREADEYLSFDEVWCVYDIDNHPRLHEARQQATANGIALAESNPCFELWALLHFEDHSAYIDRKPLRVRLKSHLPGYDKELPFSKIHPNYTDAVARCIKLARRCELGLCPSGNPSSQVYRLTERIREFGAAEQLRQRRGL
jgi:hypothetical protein